MKNILNIFAILVVMFFSYNCGGSAPASNDDWEEVSDPMKVLHDAAAAINGSNGVAAVGIGISTRQDLAREKARTRADAALAQQFNTNVENMRKDFQEEVGQGDASEINEFFSNVTKTVTKQLLIGSVEKDSKILKKGDEYQCGVLKIIPSNSAVMSILDEMQKSKPQLYQRYRANKSL